MQLCRKNFFLYSCILVVMVIACAGCFKNLPVKHVVFDRNFDDSTRNRIEIVNLFGRIDSSKIFLFNGSLALGRFNNTRISFSMDSLPDHNAVRIQFDLYIHDKWEGSHLDPVTKIPDVWQLHLDHAPIMIRTFSNTAFPQSFPDDYNPLIAQNPAHANAWALLPGVCALADKPDGTALYKIDYTTSHTNRSLSLDMHDALQPFNQPCNKSWSIDNILITAIKYN